MLTLATLILGLGAAQVADSPFQMDLPTGYPAFERANPQTEAWSSFHESGAASFEIRRFLLESPGAVTELVADDLRKTYWQPTLAGLTHSMKPWRGTWADADAAGTSIQYTYGAPQGESGKPQLEQRYYEQRLLVVDEYLILANWEGDLGHKQAAEKALATFRLPSEWKATPPPDIDVHRGLKTEDRPAPVLGHFDIKLDASDASFETLHFKVQWTPADGVEAHGKNWMLPQGAVLKSATATSVEYSIELYDGSKPAPKAGLLPGAFGLSGLGGSWLALPTGFTPAQTSYSPPPFTLEILCPPFLEAMASTGVASTELVKDNSFRRTKFQTNLTPKTWPYFVLGMYQYQEFADRAVAVRRSSKATRAESTLRFMNRLQKSCSDWLPAAREQWSVTTFPGSGDLIFPGLFVFDEGNGWLDEPVDANWVAGNRRAGLARKIASHVFGRQLAGIGHGAVFLEASLSEYAAWRILENAGLIAEADAMHTFWVSNEKALGELARPLTLLPYADLQGARRLMTRGALVWHAIEKRATRPVLDGLLNGQLSKDGNWSTEDLRKALEKQSGEDWLPFFQAHVYGRKRP